MYDVTSHQVRSLIRTWLDEDVGPGDVSSIVVVPADHHSRAVIHTKQAGVVAGLQLAELVFTVLDPALRLQLLKRDGDAISRGDELLIVEGCTRSILSGERLALNLLQRLSGIATTTRQMVDELAGLPVRLADTRKTTPGLRLLEKYAVRIGGGTNHRFGLYDAVMLKDNHIKAAGGLQSAIRQARSMIPHTMKIEVEIESLSQVAAALEADIIMLDNMPLEQMSEAVRLIRDQRPHIIIEASGNVSLQTVRNIALTGVDVISAGMLTHSVRALDISLDLNEKKESSS